MNRNLFWGLLAAVLGLTACEKGLDAEGEFTSSTASQVTNSVLQVRTRGTSPSEEATVAYPVQVYVFQGDMPSPNSSSPFSQAVSSTAANRPQNRFLFIVDND